MTLLMNKLTLMNNLFMETPRLLGLESFIGFRQEVHMATS